MWPFRSTKTTDNEDENSVYTEEEYEEDVEYEVEITDDEGDDNESESTNREGGHRADCSEETSNAGTESLAESKSVNESHDSDEDEQEIERSSSTDERQSNGANQEMKKKKNGSNEMPISAKEEEKYYSHSSKVKYKEEYNTDSEDVEYDKKEEASGSEEDHKGENNAETDDDEEDDEEDEEEGESVTTFEEKHSLLKLAAEHDRVDIIQSILSSSEQSEERLALLNHEKEPPLHIAIYFGSTNTTTCLLRLGANPAIRPDHNSETKKIIGRTAWELVFGSDTDEVKGWFSPKSKNAPIDMAESKREGIRHAFTAEALRTIGADDDDRLKQLLDSGMPSSTDIGAGKDMLDWCRDLGALKCLKLVSKQEEEKKSDEKGTEQNDTELKAIDDDAGSKVMEIKEFSEAPTTPVPSKEMKLLPDLSTTTPSTPVLIRRLSTDLNDTESLRNRLEELDTLTVNLSTYLDNLAEEVSVCHGLLLMGNGATALASHVRALKETQEVLQNELMEIKSKWTEREIELNSLLTNYKLDANEIETMSLTLTRSSSLSKSLSSNDPIELKVQLDKSENKIRRLRASIADMSEESESAMEEVNKRGLIGGIQLVRRLREQIRELEFQISEAKSSDAICASKLKHVQEQLSMLKGQKGNDINATNNITTTTPTAIKTDMSGFDPSSAKLPTISLMEDLDEKPQDGLSLDSKKPEISRQSSQNGTILKSSEKITQGHSDALMKYNSKIEGYMPMDLWQIILRIIGLGRVAVRQQVEELKKQSSTVIIV